MEFIAISDERFAKLKAIKKLLEESKTWGDYSGFNDIDHAIDMLLTEFEAYNGEIQLEESESE